MHGFYADFQVLTFGMDLALCAARTDYEFQTITCDGYLGRWDLSYQFNCIRAGGRRHQRRGSAATASTCTGSHWCSAGTRLCLDEWILGLERGPMGLGWWTMDA